MKTLCDLNGYNVLVIDMTTQLMYVTQEMYNVKYKMVLKKFMQLCQYL